MKQPDLIFHLVSKRKWKEHLHSGYYRPESTGGDDEWIECYTGSGIEEVANRKFRGRKRIFLLVINTQRLSSEMMFREVEGEEFPMVRKRINLDSIIDKIDLMPDEEGLFEIRVDVK